MTAQHETHPLVACVLMHPRAAWRSQESVDAQWRELGFTDRPDYERACDEYDAFASLLEGCGARVEALPAGQDLTLDAIYVRDASVISDRGVVGCRMGKAARGAEPAAQRGLFEALGIPVLGGIVGDGRLEGGDCVWLDRDTLAVGLGYRTNPEGVGQLGELLGPDVDIVTVPLPHWRGPGDVFHLMSILSPLDDDLALVYSPLMPVPFRETLLARGYELVEVPDEEVDMGANALALAPRRCLLEMANERTRRRLEAAGVEVIVYDGGEISRKGLGGPTCLTRPIERRPAP
ncbi:MAG: arginine deiminase family protein [Gemmatimonadota bacterium]|nr:arginine deiminase family protein [Gemmatimonadota bacterium]